MAGTGQNTNNGGVKVFASAVKGEAITPSDSTELDYSYLWIGVGGTLVVSLWEDPTGTVALENVPNGIMLCLRVFKVKAATTCSSIVGLL